MDTTQLVFKTLDACNDPQKAGEIAAKSGIDKSEVDKALKKLLKEEKIISPQRCFYTVKK
ncbi:MAG: transcriptional regulator [Bacteroidales bacterium]